jgi:hypothetical protein
MIKLRHQLHNAVDDVFNNFLSNIETMDITENGALQLLFDYMFLNTVLQNAKRSAIGTKLIQKLQDQVHYFVCDPFLMKTNASIDRSN